MNDYTKNKKIIRYILEKIENYYIEHSLPIAFSQYTIEHLIPQDKIVNYSAQQIGQIGNLIFIKRDVQEQLKNKNLKEKLDILCKLKIEIPCNNFQIEQINDKNAIDFVTNRTKLIAVDAFDKIWK